MTKSVNIKDLAQISGGAEAVELEAQRRQSTDFTMSTPSSGGSSSSGGGPGTVVLGPA